MLGRDLSPFGVRTAEGGGDAKGVVRCRVHPTFLARGTCSDCELAYCDQCLVELDLGTEKVFCVDCAMRRAGVRTRSSRRHARR